MDIEMCRLECAYLKTLDENKIRELLTKAGYAK
jgi:hypothetical protein